MQRTDDSEVVFNNGKWSSYTPQQLKRKAIMYENGTQ
ncbi:unnamed protein product [Acanthoscelides obtectus]|uniref:Uncharacterized protein n=1 Tax=Acanthoscelides obtectus TaxID=200917 RepID=A0A9P0KHR5_ACAOB|nr:unnamed protein product [Acanthoscelides obtectus]CAK1625667.1 hypothetical protein AOBTE_LOCUS3322 [Acanthoscelides obtectus]